jgi:putative membrane protein
LKINKILFVTLCPAPVLAAARGVNGNSVTALGATLPNQPTGATQPAGQRQLSAVDSDFVSKAAAGGAAEVREGQLALRQGDAKVRKIAQTMVNDHEKANKQLAALAKAKGIDVNATLDQQHSDELATLRDQKGKAFDTGYLNSELTGHEATITLFRQEADQGTDPDLKAFAKKTLPTLKHHEAMVKSAVGKAG